MKQKQTKKTSKAAEQTKTSLLPNKVHYVESSEEEVDEENDQPSVTEQPSVEDEEELEYAEQEEENEGDEENDEEMEVDDDDDDDDSDAPSEEAIEKEEPTIPSKVKIGPIPPSVSLTKVIHITKLPKKCKQINIVEAFSKYGAIDQIHIVAAPKATVANVAYKTEKAALAALADSQKVKVNDVPVSVSMKKEKKKTKIFLNRDRTVYVKYIKTGTAEEELRKHFESCGEIESVSLKSKFNSSFAFITFVDKSAVPAALKLHNSLLNGVNIRVVKNDENHEKATQLDERLAVMLRNKQNFRSIDVAKLESIFSKCGEIDNLVVVCKKNVLAFITFKTEIAVQNAIKLSGSTEQEIELEVEIYDPVKKWTSIHVSNLPKDCTVEDLTKIFSKAGEIVSVVIKRGFAVIRFTDCDGYCKSFLYNESFIKGNIIFVEPHSYRKQTVFKAKKPFPRTNFKRSSENGYNVFKPKKSKNN